MITQQADSISTTPVEAGELEQGQVVQHRHELTPAEVLSWLPKNATPAQQDSAIQAHIKPSEIHWSTEPDTLHLPGHTAGRNFRKETLPQYYKESFFKTSQFYHPELRGGRLGVAGDPVPYTVAGDNLLTSLLLLCFVFTSVAFARSRHFIARQAKNFFHTPSFGTTEVTETSGELWFQLFLALQTCLLLSIGYFLYSRVSISDTFTVEQYVVVGIYAGVVAAYFLLKTILYLVTGWIFFDKKKNGQWLKAHLFLFCVEGLLLYPVVLLTAYFGISIQAAVIYSLIVLVLVKILSFYKSYIIFFRRIGAFLQNILYFCALEMVPLLVLGGGLVLISHYLKINF